MFMAFNVVTSTNLLRALTRPESREQAWGTFLKRYNPMIYAWCRRSGLQHADAEEVSAVVLAKLVRVMDTFDYDPSRRFRGWLKTVVGNAVIDFRRREARHPADRASGSTEQVRALATMSTPSVLDELIGVLDQELRRDFARLEGVTLRVRERVEPKTWEVFRLRVLEGQKGREVAQQFGMTDTAVYVAVVRVRRMLSEEWARAATGEAAAKGD